MEELIKSYHTLIFTMKLRGQFLASQIVKALMVVVNPNQWIKKPNYNNHKTSMNSVKYNN